MTVRAAKWCSLFEVLPNSCLASPLDMTSLSEASSSVGMEGNPHVMGDPVPAGARPSAGVAANGTEPAADVQAGMVADGTRAMPPNGENNGAVSAGTEGVANTGTSMFDSPVFPQFQLGRR